MKKLKIFSVILLIISAGAFILFRVYTGVTADHTPPVITCDSEEIVVSAGTSRDELLAGVTAEDDKSGDVTDTLVVEKLSELTDEGKRIITYAAVDGSKNVGRCERTLVYSDYQPPVFHLSAPLSCAENGSIDILSCISADSVLDGSLSNQIKYSLTGLINTGAVGDYPIEFRVMDSAGKITYLSTQVEVYDKAYAGIQVELTDYLVYVQKGQPFDASPYFAGADREGALSIQSNVNTEAEGTYYVDYIVNGENIAGKSRLVVVVQ